MNYYTEQIELDDEDLFTKFINYCADFKDEFNEIRSWIKKIGNEHGADEKWFRFEATGAGDARALPPRGRFLELKNDLRLYCMRIDNANVILFSGARKTAFKTQDCDQVKPHFLLANKLSKMIQIAIIEKQIIVTNKGLEFSEHFEIEF